MKVEIFAFLNFEFIQEEINKWLEDHSNIKIKFITQSQSEGDQHGISITVSIFYIEDITKGGQED